VTDTSSEVTRFDFAFATVHRPLLASVGVTPATAQVVLTDDRLVARFGPWLCTTPYGNITDACVTGPYTAVKAIGARLSLTDSGLTFGTNTDRGVCISFERAVRGLDPLGVMRHPALTVTVEDVDGLAQAVRDRAGVTTA
jgi:hypothetical protein